jgi:hypothetical protein
VSMILTPHRLAAVYDCLRAFPPFSRWNLPPADEVVFRVTRHKDRQGHCRINSDGKTGAEIIVSEYYVGTFDTLVNLIGHEMIHLYQFFNKTDPPGDIQHNEEFRHIAKQVCRDFNWDFKQFVTT